MTKKPFDLNSSDYTAQELGNGWYMWTRLTPFTAIEKSIVRKRNKNKKNAIKIDSNDSVGTVALKIEQAINRALLEVENV